MNTPKWICHICVHEPFLQRMIRQDGTTANCSYCNQRANAYDLCALADRVDVAFNHHYRRTSPEPDVFERPALADTGFERSRRGIPVVEAIASAAEIPRPAAAEIQRLLEHRYQSKQANCDDVETEFLSTAHYEEHDPNDDHWRERWFEFEDTIKMQARFFGHHSKELLAATFADIDNIDVISAGGRQPLVIDIGPESRIKAIFRARVFQSENTLREALCRPDRVLGPPPAEIAPAGRMNARGISVFYGATGSEVAIAEVRPPVGSLVAIARFEIVRPLRILSLGYLAFANAQGSIFDETYAALRQRAAFLQTLSDYLCEPVVPAGQDLGYLPTQAVADFLATENCPRLDGVAFPSTQIFGSGQNVVLFNKAARVEELDLTKNSVIEATGAVDEEGFYTGYRLTVRSLRTNSRLTPPPQRDEDLFLSGKRDHRGPALRVDPQSLQVHEVDSVQISTDQHTVSWQETRSSRS